MSWFGKPVDWITLSGPPMDAFDTSSECSNDTEKNVDDTEPALDLHGRKHISLGGDYPYTVSKSLEGEKDGENEDNDDSWDPSYSEHSVSMQFPSHPNTTVTEMYLRMYLQQLPRDLLQDEYGNENNVIAIPSHHLPVLQSRIWNEHPRSLAPSPSPPDNLAAVLSDSPVTTVPKSPVAVVTAIPDVTYVPYSHLDCAKHLPNSLIENSVFVIRVFPPETCSHPSCSKVPHEYADFKERQMAISLEPTVDLRTLAPLSLPHFPPKMAIFVRAKDDHLDIIREINRIVDRKDKIFCFECLVDLWVNRVYAWAILNQHAT
ncbi:uncharacterized protein BDR25DRAFT_377630 [Lindgomyces ingoldianus]|uniref:Uncharacterized protein n=1 Tax=Lindgomyces ingoldianus TaxID=673940 RepID=A0ACB6QHH7_9PLEO|nr:uncharacterized protein BDR25DRAFT_377630 [Lindgomyces ingoldianus]KAF2466469.1 hypothetical protein BDR25DRAFT_377630 [Lindgomyces ingoldianus]